MTMTMHSKEINRMAGLKIITMKTNQKKMDKELRQKHRIGRKHIMCV